MENSFSSIDREIFVFFNQTLASPSLDPWIASISDEKLLFTLALIAAFLLWRRGGQTWRTYIITAVILVIFLDNVSFLVLKPWFASLRPCLEEAVVRLPERSCGSPYGFPSNHATNSMAVAALLVLWWRTGISYLAFGVALLIALTRIYLGVHYPSDILGGFAIGFLFALIAYAPFHFKILPKG